MRFTYGSLSPSMNPSVSQMNIFRLRFQCISRLQRGHLTSTIGGSFRRFYSTKRKSKVGLDERPLVLDYSCPVDLFVLPRVASKLRNLSEAACCATFLPNVVSVSATSPAPDVCTFSAHLS